MEKGTFTQSKTPIASVMIPFFERNNEPWIILTKRASHLKKHSGQVSFPGGKADPEDRNPLETAFRETQEELGIPPQEIRLLGRWNDFWTPYYDNVATYIGVLDSMKNLRPSIDEIEKLIFAPLKIFGDESKHWIEERVHEGKKYHVHYFKVDGEVVWGATGGVIFYLLRDLGVISYGKEFEPTNSGLT